jgi:hypothetical protein
MTAKPPKVDFCLIDFVFSADLVKIPGLFIGQSNLKEISVECKQNNLHAPTAALIPL